VNGRSVLSPRAQRDIEAIWDYTVENWGADQAESYIRAIRSAIETVAADPRRGRPCDNLGVGYRKYASGSHVIFYRPIAGGIDVCVFFISEWISTGICNRSEPWVVGVRNLMMPKRPTPPRFSPPLSQIAARYSRSRYS
jgi:toxin ParE1/3/4